MNRLLKTGSLLVLVALAVGGIVWLAPHRNPASGPATPASEEPSARHEPRRAFEGSSTRWQRMTDVSLSRQQRMTIAQSIHAGLSAGDADELFGLIELSPAPQDRENWCLIVNEIMEQMRKNGVGVDRYSDRLCHLIKDRDADYVIRDYAIQHLLQWVSPSGHLNVPAETDDGRKQKSLQTVLEVIQRPEAYATTISGTGLLALADASDRLSGQNAGEVWSALDPFLRNAIEGKIPTETNLKASAIQAASRMKRSGHLPAIRRLAETNGIEPSVRLSAIHALGLYADPSDRMFLERLSSLDSPFQYAARSALKQSSSPSQP